MAKQKHITGTMDLAEAVAVSKTYPLDVLLTNYCYVCDDDASDEELNRALLVRRGALFALAECPDPQTMRRMTALMSRMNDYDTGWCEPIRLRLENNSIPRAERAVALRALKPIVLRRSTDNDPDTLNALSALAALHPYPVPAPIVARCRAKLASRDFGMASAALAVILSLDAPARDPFIPALIKLMEGKFAGNSEAGWIMARLPDHLDTHGKNIVSAVRRALKSNDRGRRLAREFFAALPAFDERGKAFIPDVLAFIGRESAITHYEPRLIHLDPTGVTAIPALIELLASRSQYARRSAIDELAAYGPRAEAAVPKLTALAEGGKKKGPAFDANAARRALAAIRPSHP